MITKQMNSVRNIGTTIKARGDMHSGGTVSF